MPDSSNARRSLFSIGDTSAFELGAADVPALQRFFEANPEYFLAVNGRPSQVHEAQQVFDDLPPAGMAYRSVQLLGFGDAAKSTDLIGMATVITDFIVAGVGHIGLFIMASDLHGSGAPRAIYDALERWMQEAQGSQWLRLGVVQGNAKAERFWAKCGYARVRERGPVEMGLRQNMLSAMVKPLTGGTLADYLTMVPRDRPGAP